MWSVFFVFLSYLDRNFVKGDFLSRSLDAEKPDKHMLSVLNGTFCAKMSTLGENFLYQVSNGTEVVRSVVSPTGTLVDCSIIVNQMQVKSFMHECRLGLRGQRAGQPLHTRFAVMDEANVMCREFMERSVPIGVVGNDDTDDTALQHKTLKRSKRGFTYPGTLWCGAGNMADNYDQLGVFAETDSCCRTHDHCPHVIHAFSSNYGHINFKWHPICHCDCDSALKDCLRKVNDTSSRVVGQAFFNVIGVPCFDFVYEEQCTERHWYGLCKRYDKLPIAVLKEAVLYDFGGIDVIDKLTVAPPRKKDSKESKKGEKLENSTLSTVLGPEEPSLTNVVTAAEDFIKILATVSTSQSSTTDSDKSETQSSEKKKRKNTGKKKKTSKKLKGKGKGRKRKQKAEAGVKVEEGAGVSPSGSKAGEVIALSNFLESHNRAQSRRNRNRVDASEYELGGKEEPFNEVMKDEPPVDKDTVSMTSPKSVQKKLAETNGDRLTEETTLSVSISGTTVIPRKDRRRRPRKERRKKCKTQDTDTPASLSAFSVPTITAITPSAQFKQQSFGSHTESQPISSTTSASIVIPKVKKNRSKEKEKLERREKRRKLSSVSPIVASGHEITPADHLKVIPLTGVPPLSSLPTTGQQGSHRLGVYRGKTSFHTALNSSFSVLKSQRASATPTTQ
ncbi:Group 3 secretory phospholipase A2 [Channa argus]|uniref:phospholipase A2 n=1 Tax=Channa argus TaxID=215402 RepID=A0A6G1PQZ9_CHAAH|nr:Group 3 secretory phospholipase A2 [Channa argus]